MVPFRQYDLRPPSSVRLSRRLQSSMKHGWLRRSASCVGDPHVVQMSGVSTTFRGAKGAGL